jgi:hypothetical protein
MTVDIKWFQSGQCLTVLAIEVLHSVMVIKSRRMRWTVHVARMKASIKQKGTASETETQI